MEPFEAYLKSLIYKMITVYIVGFPEKPLVFSGILVSYNGHCMRLVIKKSRPKATSLINFNRRFQASQAPLQMGSLVEIPYSKIDAILHHPSALNH